MFKDWLGTHGTTSKAFKFISYHVNSNNMTCSSSGSGKNFLLQCEGNSLFKNNEQFSVDIKEILKSVLMYLVQNIHQF